MPAPTQAPWRSLHAPPPRAARRPTPLLPDAIRLNPHKIALAPAFFRRHRVRCGRRSNNHCRDFIGSIAGGNPTGVLQVYWRSRNQNRHRCDEPYMCWRTSAGANQLGSLLIMDNWTSRYET
ncbi:hypothetical protein PVAP13_9KG280800 [Panicum virgatum]|uniref:Uncharacterized protein n=1 Tax=Panicum virgatum TaxID=38727 RepID=A0A8T0NKI6_PANVG|nr:hypothetical protein PVAP13_9KG280800 [Panicum virgatum]